MEKSWPYLWEWEEDKENHIHLLPYWEQDEFEIEDGEELSDEEVK